MHRLLVLAAMLVISSPAFAENAVLEQLACHKANRAQYEKDLSAVYTDGKPSKAIATREITADRRMTEAYCIKQVACDTLAEERPDELKQQFQTCLDDEAAERLGHLEELARATSR